MTNNDIANLIESLMRNLGVSDHIVFPGDGSTPIIASAAVAQLRATADTCAAFTAGFNAGAGCTLAGIGFKAPPVEHAYREWCHGVSNLPVIDGTVT